MSGRVQPDGLKRLAGGGGHLFGTLSDVDGVGGVECGEECKRGDVDLLRMLGGRRVNLKIGRRGKFWNQ